MQSNYIRFDLHSQLPIPVCFASNTAASVQLIPIVTGKGRAVLVLITYNLDLGRGQQWRPSARNLLTRQNLAHPLSVLAAGQDVGIVGVEAGITFVDCFAIIPKVVSIFTVKSYLKEGGIILSIICNFVFLF